MTEEQKVIQLADASVIYEEGADPALKNINLTVKQGEFICVLGRSGAGKSTFIRTINALQPLQEGSVQVLNKDLAGLSEKQIRSVRADIGMIFQHFHLIPRLSVLQNVYTGRFGHRPSWKNLLGIFSDQEKETAEHYLSEVGLLEYAGRRVERLSGGQKQRVGIARAMVQEPAVLLGDEPVASLDPTTSDHIFQLLRRLHEDRDLTTIVNVHDVELASAYADRIIGLYEGELVFDGKPGDMNQRTLQSIYR
ncbi:phosphonate ABC transporter ATP-binding protein [Alkalicoccus urumqiensis]|uniref:Phosphonate ABC transporter ATP-binding protein n=1 Tax=Alkalicoccus urumqiensis TaxID=1548213 RepID=A0A2P6MF09_ALKUR|nr:phosphonate ABC transporter ATP-binding protein [Alkalicoccus urumqiensis]PRO64831.1 phosphonate ABC transporter ATP-binding protein [Alkalicoccus urumqiensis]